MPKVVREVGSGLVSLKEIRTIDQRLMAQKKRLQLYLGFMRSLRPSYEPLPYIAANQVCKCTNEHVWLSVINVLTAKENPEYWRHYQKRESLGLQDIDSGPETKVDSCSKFGKQCVHWQCLLAKLLLACLTKSIYIPNKYCTIFSKKFSGQ